jgi:hypothetical protein
MLQMLREVRPSVNYTEYFEFTVADAQSQGEEPPFRDLTEEAQDETATILDKLVSEWLVK